MKAAIRTRCAVGINPPSSDAAASPVTIETRQDGIHVDPAHCTQPIAIDLKATIYVQRQGAAWPSGQAMASSTRYEHTLHCGPDDTTHALAIRGLKPMRVDLELPTPSRPNIIVHLDPGNVQMNFDVVGSAHSHDQWWLENFKAHMVHYGADSPYKLPMPAVEDGDIQKTFSGSGGYTDDTGTWNGNEFVTITIKRNF
ncbi:MAG: hypothetical protein IPL47_18050 [Phyllobacteriaceae bacterium]|nr:hypothetical protein [Phyllobacteriaceae bacterium]